MSDDCIIYVSHHYHVRETREYDSLEEALTAAYIDLVTMQAWPESIIEGEVVLYDQQALLDYIHEREDDEDYAE